MTKYGFYELDITPQLGVGIPGYFEKREVKEILSNLYVKAIVADDGKKVTAICVVDGICVMTDTCEEAVKYVCENTDIDPEGILIQATHIHTGGAVRKMDNGNDDRNKRYKQWVTDKIADCIILAYNNREEMSAVYNMEKVYGISFVRNYIMKDGSIVTNPEFGSKDIVKRFSDIDPDMPYLFFTDKDGNPRGALVNFACHHDCVGGENISADYSGILAKKLREKFGKDFITVFMNGFCGNINNWDCIGKTERPARENHIEMGETLANALINTLPDAQKMSDERVDFAKELMDIKRRDMDPNIVARAKELLNRKRSNNVIEINDVQGDDYLIATAPGIVSSYGDDAPLSYKLYSQAIRLGDCVIYALPGEVYAQYGEYLKENAPTEKVFLAELANSRIGYIPVPQMYNEPSVYEGTPTAALLHEGGGMELAKKASELGNELF